MERLRVGRVELDRYGPLRGREYPSCYNVSMTNNLTRYEDDGTVAHYTERLDSPTHRNKVRTVTFRTAGGKLGTATGIVITNDSKVLRLVSAGCRHGFYRIAAESTLVSVVDHDGISNSSTV